MRIVLDLQGAQSESRFRGIGRYSLGLSAALVREASQHEVWLALSGRFPDSIEPLRARFMNLVPAERIRVFELPGPVAEAYSANTWRMHAAELLREKFLADLRPDIVHLSTLFEGVANETVVSVGRLNSTIPTAATLYDLIPLFFPEKYLRSPAVKRSYMRHALSLKRADILLAISESTRREAIDVLGISPERIVTIGTGLDQGFQGGEPSCDTQVALRERYGLRRPFVLYTSVFEPRKNVEGLIAAFALLPQDIRSAHQLAIAGKLREGDHNRLVALAGIHGLSPDEIVCLDHVPDDELRVLYSICSLFVFPSLHEGFGLPILEAMVCGAPVIGSNCTSIPEIIDRSDALFDPRRPEEIASRMAAVLSNTELRQSLKTWGSERAKTFTWERCAREALKAFESLHAKRKAARTAAVSVTKRRPVLAFVSPLPPAQTGIAGYSAKLLPNLASHYEVVCITDQPEVTDPWITAEFPIRDARWFEANGAKFDRILYHFGNSSFHEHMLALIERQPGVVVWHDFCLGGLLRWMDGDHLPGCFAKALYDSHGFSALQRWRSGGCEPAMTYPCNAAAFRNSIGAIVHSEYAINLARKWYGDRASAFMRRVPFLPFPPRVSGRLAARERMGIPENTFLVCSFGFLGPAKLNHRLLDAWLASPLREDQACFLTFVGENHGGDYGQQLLEKIAQSRAASSIRITGYVEAPHYCNYLAAADVAVQLRTGSMGETSAAIFDCLSCNVPLVINAHGSAADFPNDVLIKLDDDFADAELSAALTHLRAEPSLRQKLAERGALYVRELHQPERVAELYRNAIEELYDTSIVAREQTLLQAIARTSTQALPSEADLEAVAALIVANGERFGLKQILVDVTNITKSDLRTGIERVTRAILLALINDPPPGYRVEPVRAAGGTYLYARQFASKCLALRADGLNDDPVEAGHGDIFLGVNWSADVVPSLKPWFLTQGRRGMKIFFVVYDVLPLTRPELFPEIMPGIALDWINAVAEVADGVVCISRTVADQLYEWLSATEPPRLRPLSLGFFHLGADLDASLPTTGLSHNGSETLEKLRSHPSLLMVGTLEPRKGHRQALAAMEQLWAERVDLNLVIVGKQGWNINDLAQRIREHPEFDKRLFWLPGISDEMLERVYHSADALLAPSEGEGFGLPLIEAAQHGLPIIARDIPVFREVAGENAYYFSGKDPQVLANALRSWLSLGDAVPASTGISWLTWQQSSRQLLDAVLNNRWHRWWPNGATIHE
jgi:glycosyltransferase involved in cell wall biosynthesis